MGPGVWKVYKEGLALVSRDKIHCASGKVGSELFLVLRSHGGIDDFLVFVQRKIGKGIRSFGMVRPHIIGVGNAIKFIEAVSRWQKLRLKAQMPFSIYCGSVSFLLQHFCNGLFRISKADF